jgi:hypothetical protein
MSRIDRITGAAAGTRREAAARGRATAEGLRGRRSGVLGTFLMGAVAAAAGAVVAFLFDPERGTARRARLADQLAAIGRRGVHTAGRAARIGTSLAGGKLAAIRHAGSQGQPDLNDAALAEKVESTLFRDPKVDKGLMNINVERGIVVLRGEVDSPKQRDQLEAAAAAIAGVWSVRNLLRVPGEPVPEELARSKR